MPTLEIVAASEDQKFKAILFHTGRFKTVNKGVEFLKT